MNAQELRIGNLVYAGEDENWQPYACTVESINSDFITWSGNKTSLLFVNPIPLSPEWLEKCGFENDDADYLKSIDDRSCIHINFKKERHVIESYDGIIKIPQKIQYVHQLMNLYHALTGTELVIDQTKNG